MLLGKFVIVISPLTARMKKELIVYPIASGSILNVFATNEYSALRILDMEGNVIMDVTTRPGTHSKLDIHELDDATYIVEVTCVNEHKARSVFVKT